MDIILFGTGTHAELVHYLFTHDSPHTVVAFCVDEAFLSLDKPTCCGLPIVSTTQALEYYAPTCYGMHIAVGRNEVRAAAFAWAKVAGYQCVNYISTKAQTWPDLVMGENVFIDPACIVHPFVTLGDNVLLLGAWVGHHNRVGSHSLLSCATLGGSVSVGEHCFLGMKSVIRDGVRLGQHNLIGVGAYIAADTPDEAVFSAPAARQRSVPASRVNVFK